MFQEDSWILKCYENYTFKNDAYICIKLSSHYYCYFCQPQNISATHSPCYWNHSSVCNIFSLLSLVLTRTLTEGSWIKELGVYLVGLHHTSDLGCQTTSSNSCFLSWISYNQQFITLSLKEKFYNLKNLCPKLYV